MRKHTPLLVPLCAVLLWGFSLVWSTRSHAEEITFACEIDHDGVLLLIRRDLRGEFPLIRWTSDGFSGVESYPKFRCDGTARRFQDYSDRGWLHDPSEPGKIMPRTLITKIVDNQNVVCISRSRNGQCSGMLLALPPNIPLSTFLNRFVIYYNRSPELQILRRQEIEILGVEIYQEDRYLRKLTNTLHLESWTSPDSCVRRGRTAWCTGSEMIESEIDESTQRLQNLRRAKYEIFKEYTEEIPQL